MKRNVTTPSNGGIPSLKNIRPQEIHRDVRPLNCGSVPLKYLVGPESVAVREMRFPGQESSLRKLVFSSLIIVVEGAIDYTIAGHEISIKAPAFLMIPRQTPIYNKVSTKAVCILKYICLTGAMSYRLDPARRLEKPFLHVSDSETCLVNPMLEAIQAAFDPGWESPWKINECLSKVYRKLIKMMKCLSSEDQQIVAEVQAAVNGDWKHPRTVHEIASKLGLSTTELNARFRRETSFSPAEWIRHQRIRLAKDYLYNGFSIKETADLLNFSSPYALSRTFKANTGVSPKSMKH